jgi:hypothetical protein
LVDRIAFRRVSRKITVKRYIDLNFLQRKIKWDGVESQERVHPAT